MLQQIAQRYTQFFKSPAVLVQAPGRINIIGEHTDYNQGWVLPAAIDKYIYFALGKKDSATQFEFYSPQFEERIQFDVQDALETMPSWGKYLLAAAQELQKRGYIIAGTSGVLSGDIPVGAGLSSSAALCCGFVYGMNELYDLKLSRQEIALIAQATEHRIGLNCGLMDQYASLFGKKDCAILLDCNNLELQHIPLELGKYELYIINSNVKHELAADSGYNERRASCEQVVKQAKTLDPSIQSLRDVSMEQLEKLTDELVVKDYKRARYVLHENERVLDAAAALRNGNLKSLGKLLKASHKGMREEYKITVPEIDLLVDLAAANKEILGSRMMGGGFGGCTINIVEKATAPRILSKIMAAYHLETNLQAECYKVQTGDGVKIVAL